jgi:hypothetical protein
MNPRLLVTVFALVVFAACKKDAPVPPDPHDHPGGTVHPDEPAGHVHEHTERIALGDVKVGDLTISVFQVIPRIEAGKEGDFDLDFPAGKPLPGIVRGWIGAESGQGSMKAKFEKETATRMHGHPEAPQPIPAGSMLWLEVETAGGTSKASLAFRP